MSIEAYPLCWPEGWSLTPAYKRKHSPFKITPGRALDELQTEIKRLTGRAFRTDEVIISTNIRIRQDGLPYADQRKQSNPGVAVYFKFKGKPMVFACDNFLLLHDNMHAISKTINALRGIERWGASDMLERAFTGFAALPFYEAPEKWNSVLQVGNLNFFTLEDCKRNYRLLAAEYHPDMKDGSHDKMVQLNAAMAEAKKYFGA